jgi:TRAP-type C4-dicarboxylate transport system permease large subunit
MDQQIKDRLQKGFELLLDAYAVYLLPFLIYMVLITYIGIYGEGKPIEVVAFGIFVAAIVGVFTQRFFMRCVHVIKEKENRPV